MAKAIICGKLFDSIDGNVKSNKVIIIEGNEILNIADKALYKKEANDEVIDLSGKFVMPGLIDAHVHLMLSGDVLKTKTTQNKIDRFEFLIVRNGIKNARANLMGGFTTVRDAGFQTLQGCQRIRDAVNAGKIPGPRIFCCGPAITVTGGHFDFPDSGEKLGRRGARPLNVINSPVDSRYAARMVLKHGADQIKLLVGGGVNSRSGAVDDQHMSYDEIEAAVEVAVMHNRIISVHAHGASGIRDSARAGVTSIEHCTLADDEGIELMVKNRVAAVPTFIVIKLIAEEGLKAGMPEDVVEKARYLAPLHASNIRKAYERGVRVIFGTDTGTPLGYHGKQHGEFELMVKAGISQRDVLLSATRYAAEMMRWDDRVGSIEPGKLADIVAIDGDPLNDISCMKNVSFIMKDGKVYKSI